MANVLAAFKKDKDRLAIRLRPRDHRGFLGRAFRVPKSCVYLEDVSNQVYGPGCIPGPQSEGILTKNYVRSQDLTIADLDSNSGELVTVVLTVGVAVRETDLDLAKFRNTFLSSAQNGGVTVRQVCGWVQNQITNSVRNFISQQTVHALYNQSLWDIYEDLAGAIRRDFASCKIHAGITVFPSAVRFECGEIPELRRQLQALRQKDFEAKCRQQIRDIEALDKKGELLKDHEIEQYYLALKHEEMRKKWVTKLEFEEFKNRYVQLRAERVKAVAALRMALGQERLYVDPGRGWVIQAVLGVLGVCSIIGVIWYAYAYGSIRVNAVSDQLNDIIILLRNNQHQKTTVAMPAAEKDVAVVPAYRYLGDGPAARPVRGILRITRQSISFTSSPDAGEASFDFQIPLDGINEVIYRGERETILLRLSSGRAYQVLLDTSGATQDLTQNRQLFSLLENLIKEHKSTMNR